MTNDWDLRWNDLLRRAFGIDGVISVLKLNFTYVHNCIINEHHHKAISSGVGVTCIL